MTNIVISDLTNDEGTELGTGIFDVLMASTNEQIKEQYDEGRITGVDYATVYLGALQTVLQQSVQILLSKEESGFKGEIARNQVDTTIAQTAKVYADVALLDQKQITELAQTTNPTGGLLKAQYNKIAQDTALTADQEAEVVASTVRNNNDSASKVVLMAAQTLGFKSDTKQKLLKLMFDGYAVNTSIVGEGNLPEASLDAAIDQLCQDILDDLDSSVVIQSTTQTPDTGD
jgi:hypothetical protein